MILTRTYQLHLLVLLYQLHALQRIRPIWASEQPKVGPISVYEHSILVHEKKWDLEELCVHCDLYTAQRLDTEIGFDNETAFGRAMINIAT
jgi:hypothetical protein